MFRQIIECAKTKGTGITAIFELEKVGGKSLGLRIFGNILDMVVSQDVFGGMSFDLKPAR